MKNIILLIAGDPNSINSELVFKSWRRLKQRKRKNIILIEPEYGELDFHSFNKVDELVGVWYREAEKYI